MPEDKTLAALTALEAEIRIWLGTKPGDVIRRVRREELLDATISVVGIILAEMAR